MTTAAHLELQAFRKGFHAGADPSGQRRRYTVDQNEKMHRAWRRGFTAGQAMAAEAAAAYGAELEADARGPR